MDASGVVLEEPELAVLLRVNADKGKADEVYRLLHRTRTLIRQVCGTTAQVVEAWFWSDATSQVGVDKWDPSKVKEGIIKGGGGWHGQGWLGKQGGMERWLDRHGQGWDMPTLWGEACLHRH